MIQMNNTDYEHVRSMASESVRERIRYENAGLSDEIFMGLIEEAVMKESEGTDLSFRDRSMIVDTVFNIMRKELDILQPYSDDESVREIMVNGPDNIFAEKEGRMVRLPIRFESREHLQDLIRRIAARVHREINDINPIVDARLSDGSRVNAVYSNIAIDGPILTIRKFPKRTFRMADLIRSGTITEEAAEFLKAMVETGHNIFVSGGTSSGKTTFLNVLSDFIPSDERVIVIEDSAELQLEGIENLVRLETRNANSQGRGAVSIRQLIKTAMRMRPDRIIVGEVRGGEAIDMIQALNSGHDGCMSTGHANSAQGMMHRLETMILTAESFPLDAVRHQIVSALDLVVHLGRFHDMSRKVMEISEVIESQNGNVEMNQIFVYSDGALKRTGNRLKDSTRLMMRRKGGEAEFV